MDQYKGEYENASESSSATELDAFMRQYKHFRQFRDLKDLRKKFNDFIEVQNLDESNQQINKFDLPNIDKVSKEILRKYGLKETSEWKCYSLESVPGLLVIANPFKNGYQRYLVKMLLDDCHKLPNKTNLDMHTKRCIDSNLWTEAVKSKDFNQFNKLRWATVGYHYDWTNKVYYDEDFNEIPEYIREVCETVAFAMGFDDFRSEAGIVNYYHLNSTLSAHQDHSEENMKAPLVSISLGNPAIFLIGDDTKQTKPQAILLRSGDVVLMTGKSRYSYHAVPKIFKDEIEGYFKYESENPGDNEKVVGDEEWSQFYNYISLNRLNLNIRQVY